MRLRFVILIVSLAINALIATALLRNHAPAGRETASGSPGAKPVAAQSARDSAPLDSAATAVSETAVSSAQPSFHWSQLETQDYVDYIARMRAFGVPEKVIRDIIIADVAKLYRPRFAALRPPKTDSAEDRFWERRMWFNPNANQTAEQREQLRALQKEQMELVKTLLGENVYMEMARDSGQPDWTERMFGPLTTEEREKVGELRQRLQEATSEIHAKMEGHMDQESQQEIKALQRKFREDLAGFLTPEQIEAYELRSSDVANNMRWQLGPFDPNEEEFRAIYQHKRALEDLNPSRNPDDEDQRPSPEEMKARQQKQKELEETLAQTLGPDRLKEYQLMEDWNYRNLFEAGIAKESVFRVADMKKEVEDATRKIRNDSTLTPEQRTAALQAVRSETEKELATLLGERRARSYANQGGFWVRNIAPRN